MLRYLALLQILTAVFIELTFSAEFTCDDIVEKLSDCGELTKSEGEFIYRDLKIKYWVYEDQKNKDESQLPLILIHGGPGFPSTYLEPLKQLACRGRKIIRYDQAGAGESFIENVAETAPFLFDIPYYLDELAALLAHLDLKHYNLLGHSWGTIVAQEFAMKNPKGLASLILAGALSSGKFYIEEQRRLRHTTLPPYLQKVIKQMEETKDFESDLYNKLNEYLTGLWTVRTIPMPDCVEAAFAKPNFEIYYAINGHSEFTMHEKMMSWDVTGKVNGDTYPTIVIGGEHDTMTDTCLKQVTDGIKGSSLHILPASGHICMVDQPDLFMDIAQKFLVDNEHKNEHLWKDEL